MLCSLAARMALYFLLPLFLFRYILYLARSVYSVVRPKLFFHPQKVSHASLETSLSCLPMCRTHRPSPAFLRSPWKYRVHHRRFCIPQPGYTLPPSIFPVCYGMAFLSTAANSAYLLVCNVLFFGSFASSVQFLPVRRIYLGKEESSYYPRSNNGMKRIVKGSRLCRVLCEFIKLIL